jgi:hypothetical protein
MALRTFDVCARRSFRPRVQLSRSPSSRASTGSTRTWRPMQRCRRSALYPRGRAGAAAGRAGGGRLPCERDGITAVAIDPPPETVRSSEKSADYRDLRPDFGLPRGESRGYPRARTPCAKVTKAATHCSVGTARKKRTWSPYRSGTSWRACSQRCPVPHFDCTRPPAHMPECFTIPS